MDQHAGSPGSSTYCYAELTASFISFFHLHTQRLVSQIHGWHWRRKPADEWMAKIRILLLRFNLTSQATTCTTQTEKMPLTLTMTLEIVKYPLWFARKWGPVGSGGLWSCITTDKLVFVPAKVLHSATEDAINVKLGFTNCRNITLVVRCVSEKTTLTWHAISLTSVNRLRQFWQNCSYASKLPNHDFFMLPLTNVSALPWEHEPQKLHVFTQTLCSTLLTNTETLSIYHLVISDPWFISNKYLWNAVKCYLLSNTLRILFFLSATQCISAQRMVHATQQAVAEQNFISSTAMVW